MARQIKRSVLVPALYSVMQNDSHECKHHLGLYTGTRYPGESVWCLASRFDIKCCSAFRVNGLGSGTRRRGGDEHEGRSNGKVRRNVEESAGIERAYIREQVTSKADSHIACRVHAVPLPCRTLIRTCHAAPLPCSDSAVSFVKVLMVAGNIRTAGPTV